MRVVTEHVLRVGTLLAIYALLVLLMRAISPSNWVLVHSFYFPVLLAAYWYHMPGGVGGGAVAGFAASPYFLSIVTPSEYLFDAWIVRALFFVGIGLTVGYMCSLLRQRRQRVESNVRQLARTYARTLKSLVYLLEHHDEETSKHCERVAANALRLGDRLGLSEVDRELLYWAAYLHDIGKLASPARMLLKEGPLSPSEYEVMKQHATIGANTLHHISPDLAPVAEAVHAHHERWDGAGYPRGLSGEEIPLFGRILAVVDAFEAMTSDRPYRKAIPAEEAAKVLEGEAGKQFDPELVRVYLELLEEGRVHIEAHNGSDTGLGFPEEFNLQGTRNRARRVPAFGWVWR